MKLWLDYIENHQLQLQYSDYLSFHQVLVNHVYSRDSFLLPFLLVSIGYSPFYLISQQLQLCIDEIFLHQQLIARKFFQVTTQKNANGLTDCSCCFDLKRNDTSVGFQGAALEIEHQHCCLIPILQSLYPLHDCNFHAQHNVPYHPMWIVPTPYPLVAHWKYIL